MQKLNDMLCVVTGGSRGIGEAVCAAFIAEGARVILTEIDETAGAATAARLDCEFRQLDVASEPAWAALESEHPAINVLVNNAGITGFATGTAPHDPETASLADWRRVHAVNTDGCFLGCRYALRAMKEGGDGSIINISSRSGMVGIPGAAAYAASKAAIRNHTKSVALYAAQQGWRIRCNSVHPAAVLTPMWEPMLGQGEEREAAMAALVADTPLKRFGRPEEVAALCVYLASADSAYMTGAELTMDGGLLAGSAASPG
ncbi:SDR family oxidoreductase [Qipengyuania sp. GH1]|uniref:SDR family oxidoreductase n=1 Tax=Qipengyuania aestuarii TaxID=2867241 RepID=UPI001C881AB0|nr:SDR family oxidoreductase [Qipengyuania aestuarii]MBX7534833.1 SDR family oxidoreductase [Qipengyuania aestuarii]